VDLRLACIRGLGLGFIAHGQPDIEYVEALKFCQNTLLAPDEHKICYESVLSAFKDIYPKDKVLKICTTVDPQYTHYCDYH